MMEWKLGNIEEARDVFQRGVWADPRNKNAARLFQVLVCGIDSRVHALTWRTTCC